MKLPERSDRYLCPTTTITGVTLMVLHLTSTVTGWAWPFLYVALLFMGHSQEYKDLRIWKP
tara:strand:- start:11194 stop:11376 length:183 start_codon:yes stop_codon:yes gene_type:complete